MYDEETIESVDCCHYCKHGDFDYESFFGKCGKVAVAATCKCKNFEFNEELITNPEN